MQLSHFISDLVLSVIAAWAWWKLVAPHRPLNILWGAFFIPVALAALFGAARFAGTFSEAAAVSKFFQQAASSIGAVGMICGSWFLTRKFETTGRTSRVELVAVTVGLILLLCGRFKWIPFVFDLAPVVAMLYLLGLGLLHLICGPSTFIRKIGAGLISAVIRRCTTISYRIGIDLKLRIVRFSRNGRSIVVGINSI